eukprot:TRINITY_DN4383_c0_g1_i1.p1 TRINITY_DN4383_c0_g1~~TRINITY_DN4383_c0_g1_i1.p1  ORF type:complete len:106 (-),score=23.02 TRINITY_DN4383_c0_g1_i1:27-344(-)
MQGASFRADGVPQFKLEVQCGWEAPYAMNKWQSTSKYVVYAAKSDRVSEIIDRIKEMAGPTSRADRLWACADGNRRVKLDVNKTLEENGLTDWGKFELRFPNSLG